MKQKAGIIFNVLKKIFRDESTKLRRKEMKNKKSGERHSHLRWVIWNWLVEIGCHLSVSYEEHSKNQQQLKQKQKKKKKQFSDFMNSV